MLATALDTVVGAVVAAEAADAHGSLTICYDP
jgi:hypothetical protein